MIFFVFFTFSSHLAALKVLSFGKIQINLVFLSLIRTFACKIWHNHWLKDFALAP